MNDCGATESIGGTAALEKLTRFYAKKYDTAKMRIDRRDPVAALPGAEEDGGP